MSTRPNGRAAADQHGRPDVRAAVEQAEDTDEGQGGRCQTGGELDRRSHRFEELSQGAGRQQEHRDTDEHRQRSPEAGKDPQERDVPFHSAHENVKLDAGGDVLAGCHRELESSTVGYTGGDGHVQRLMEQLGAASVALRARLGPRLAASTAPPARAAHRNIERHGGAGARLPIGETNGRPHLRGSLVGEERAADARERHVNRRKVDGDFVGKAARRRDGRRPR